MDPPAGQVAQCRDDESGAEPFVGTTPGERLREMHDAQVVVANVFLLQPREPLVLTNTTFTTPRLTLWASKFSALARAIARSFIRPMCPSHLPPLHRGGATGEWRGYSP